MDCFPDKASPILITKDAGVWSNTTNRIVIVPADTISKYIKIKGILVSDISAMGDYQLDFFQGDDEIYLSSICFARSASLSQEGVFLNGDNLLHPNKQLSAALSSGNSDRDNVKIKIMYEHKD